MTDTITPVDSAPWPIPEGSVMAEKLASTLRLLEEAVVSILEPEAMAFVEGRPVKRDPVHAVWLHDAARLIDSLEVTIDKAREVQAFVAAHFAGDLPYRTTTVSYGDTRPLTPRWGGERKKWANDLLQEDVKPRLLFDPETGGARTPPEVLDAALSVLSLIGSNVKVTGLRALGLEADDYCHKEPKPPTVQVVK